RIGMTCSCSRKSAIKLAASHCICKRYRPARKNVLVAPLDRPPPLFAGKGSPSAETLLLPGSGVPNLALPARNGGSGGGNGGGFRRQRSSEAKGRSGAPGDWQHCALCASLGFVAGSERGVESGRRGIFGLAGRPGYGDDSDGELHRVEPQW